MSIRRRGEKIDGQWVENGDWFYRFSYGGVSYCKGGFRTIKAATDAERIAYDHAQNPEKADKEVKRIYIEEACPIFLAKHGPSLKGGISKRSQSSYYGLRVVLEGVQEAWRGRFIDTISDLDVRDYLSAFKTTGTRMRYLGIVSKLFKSLEEWNDDRNILPERLSLPSYNPAKRWRSKMKPAQKKEHPLTRVLSLAEWQKFSQHLSPRAHAICNIALRRFLRLADIRQISFRAIKNQMIEGLSAKTGGLLLVPALSNQPESYDFTNFEREFMSAQVAAGMVYPTGHPLHFTARDLRRTGATWTYAKTRDLRSIQKMLGHAKLSTTERYLNVTYEDLAGMAHAIDSIVDTIIVEPVSALQQNCNGNSEVQKYVSQNASI